LPFIKHSKVLTAHNVISEVFLFQFCGYWKDYIAEEAVVFKPRMLIEYKLNVGGL